MGTRRNFPVNFKHNSRKVFLIGGVSLLIVSILFQRNLFRNENIHTNWVEHNLLISKNKIFNQSSECKEWRVAAYNISSLYLYRKHFLSHDVTDWFLYASLFTEKWHNFKKRRPVYLDIAANHARRWSSTWFFDRCMGWDGVCVEPNKIYRNELKNERSCRLVPKCVSDRDRSVNFSLTGAYGGIVADPSSGDAAEHTRVNGSHKTDKKFNGIFKGFKEMTCTTVNEIFATSSRIVHIDFLSLDVEGHELPVLYGIDWERIYIDVIVIENKSKLVRKFLRKRKYHRYKILEDDIWIRKGSNLFPDSEVVTWMKRLDREEFKFLG